jgi:hypothetical protein
MDTNNLLKIVDFPFKNVTTFAQVQLLKNDKYVK